MDDPGRLTAPSPGPGPGSEEAAEEAASWRGEAGGVDLVYLVSSPAGGEAAGDSSASTAAEAADLELGRALGGLAFRDLASPRLPEGPAAASDDMAAAGLGWTGPGRAEPALLTAGDVLEAELRRLGWNGVEAGAAADEPGTEWMGLGAGDATPHRLTVGRERAEPPTLAVRQK